MNEHSEPVFNAEMTTQVAFQMFRSLESNPGNTTTLVRRRQSWPIDFLSCGHCVIQYPVHAVDRSESHLLFEYQHP